MKLTPLPIAGAYQVDLEPRLDDRGYFARSFCREAFAAAGVDFPVAQCNVSYNREAFTLRGLHYQAPPCPEIKLVRCTSGRIWDCLVDLRPQSSSYRQWWGEELDAQSGRALLIPARCAHGFLSLSAGAEVLYMMSAPYAPDCGRGVRWDDPAFAIKWPAAPAHLSEKDLRWPDYRVP